MTREDPGSTWEGVKCGKKMNKKELHLSKGKRGSKKEKDEWLVEGKGRAETNSPAIFADRRRSGHQ